MEITIDRLQTLVTKASALNSVLPSSDVQKKLREILDTLERELKVYQIEEHGRVVRREVEISNIEKKIIKEFSTMTDSIMNLVKIKTQ